MSANLVKFGNFFSFLVQNKAVELKIEELVLVFSMRSVKILASASRFLAKVSLEISESLS